MVCKTGQYHKTSAPYDIFTLTQSLEGWPTKAEKVPSPHGVKTNPARHQHSIWENLDCFEAIKKLYNIHQSRGILTTWSKTKEKTLNKVHGLAILIKSSTFKIRPASQTPYKQWPFLSMFKTNSNKLGPPEKELWHFKVILCSVLFSKIPLKPKTDIQWK